MRTEGFRPCIRMEANTRQIAGDAMSPFPPGPLLVLSKGNIEIEVAPGAGGRIALIRRGGVEQLAGYSESNAAMIAWGCYPMLPWAGRVRGGKFEFDGRSFQLPLNMGAHAIHGLGFALPWEVGFHEGHVLELSLELPQDGSWPFGGRAHHRMELGDDSLLLTLSLQAGSLAMPATIGWHPWFRKPDDLRFSPTGLYPRDDEGIATLPVVQPVPGPWDDCFVNAAVVALTRGGQQMELTSDCTRWVVYDETAAATCIEPQSGPPDAFNIEPFALGPGETLVRWFRMAWSDR